MKKVTYTRPAIRQFSKLPETTRNELIRKINRNAEAGLGDVKAMKGEGSFRLRVGDYRIIFEIEGELVSVVAAGHRREIYR